MIARIHVAAWAETYPGLLPRDLIESVTLAEREATWARAIAQATMPRGEARGTTRIAVAEGVGFAQMGPQRGEGAEAAWPEELWSLYLLRAAQGRGLGRALVGAVEHGPFTACVVEGNAPAVGFYEAMGGRLVETRDAAIRGAPIRERLYAFDRGSLAAPDRAGV